MTLRYFALQVTNLMRAQCGCLLVHLGFSSQPVRSMSVGKKRDVEALWRDFFADTSQWWDHRAEKINPRFPDFKHKQTGEALWLVDSWRPPWVQAHLSTIPAGTLQSSVFVWGQRLKRYVKSGQYTKTMEVFHQMQQERIPPDSWTFLPVLNACAGLGSLEEGKRIHTQIIQLGCDSHAYVSTCLVDMYAKCGSIADAWSVFDKMQERDVVSWSAMIGGYVKAGQGQKAIELFGNMQQEGVDPDTITFIGVLNACASLGALEEGRHIHEQIIQAGCTSDGRVANCLVDMYAKCGSIEDAWSVFKMIQRRDVVSWTAMISGYVKCGQGLKAMELFQNMQQEGVEPNTITFGGVLNACASVAALEEGRRVHKQIIQRGCESDGYVATRLVEMYARCGSFQDAWSVFNKMRKQDVVAWNAIIGGYVKSGQALKAMELFRKMQREGVEPNIVTFVRMLTACANVAALEEGRRVHEQIIERGYECNIHLANCLVDMYAKCASIDDAWSVFNKIEEHDVVSWSAMIAGYVKSGQGLKAMELFQRMQHEGVEPNVVTFVGLLNACASVAGLDEGRRAHELIIQRGFDSDVFVATCLVDMYAKCGSIEDACIVFNKMGEHDVVSWNAMIGGYVRAGHGLKALELFHKMQQEGLEPNSVTFVEVLNACATVAALEQGKHVHQQIIKRGCESDNYVATCLVDMYAKCGSIEDACWVFTKTRENDVASWSAMIGGFAMHGHAIKAVGLFRLMCRKGMEINGITFICLLSACSHGGLVKEGLRYFGSMISCYNIVPTVEHYACMVDLLGRAGRLKEAEEMTKRMPVERSASAWMSLLGACRIHGNVEMAERAAKQCRDFDPESASGHVLLANIHAAAGKWDRSAAIQKERFERKALREPGRTWIEVNNVVHLFLVDDKEHPEILDIQGELERLLVEMNGAGYMPHSRFSLNEEKRGSQFFHHSEKVACP